MWYKVDPNKPKVLSSGDILITVTRSPKQIAEDFANTFGSKVPQMLADFENNKLSDTLKQYSTTSDQYKILSAFITTLDYYMLKKKHLMVVVMLLTLMQKTQSAPSAVVLNFDSQQSMERADNGIA